MGDDLRFTSADLFNFPDDNERRELIDGELYVSAHPDFYHQLLCTAFGYSLSKWSGELNVGQAAGAPGLIFSEYDDVVPDVVYVSHERLAQILVGGKLRAAPELIVEVLSPGARNVARDRETKLKLYARRGVDEYWIADWPAHRVECYRHTGVELALAAAFGPGDTLTSPLLPGFSVPINELFEDIPLDGSKGGA